MRVLYLGITFVVCLAVSGCTTERSQEPPEITVKNQTNESKIRSATKSSPPQDDHPVPVPAPAPAPPASDETVILDVLLIKQNPQLKYGCEVTSLAMVLKHAGIQTDKVKLANELPKDNDPVKKTKSGNITSWGNPDHGFVGDITGKTAGYAVYAGPLEKLMKKYLHNRTVNLTKRPFDEILGQIKKGKPVILWTTGDYKLPDRWESWEHGNEKINTPLDLHAVVLVGFDKEHLYINDPLSGKKKQKTKKDSFLKSWNALGQQALSYN